MKKMILLLMFPLISSILFGQQQEDAEKLVQEGVSLEDDGKSDSAISNYLKALELDKDNLMALTEMSYSLLSVGQYDEAIKYCKRAIKTHKGDNGLKIVYVSYGNAFDMLKKSVKSIEVYNEGIKLFPEYFQLYYNKGISLTGENKNEDAILCFQKAITLNPDHAASHYAIGKLLFSDNKRVPALLAFCRFLALAPEVTKSKEGLDYVQKIMKGDVPVNDKNSVTVHLSPDLNRSGTNDKEQKPNNFYTTDLILSVSAARNDDSSNQTITEIGRFINRFGTVCNSLKETEKDNYGFYWDYYVPYFTEMSDKDLVKTFAYIAFASSEDPAVSDWLKSHKTDVDNFYKWSEAFSWRIN
jgi:Tfp pilus assembly protein PilF